MQNVSYTHVLCFSLGLSRRMDSGNIFAGLIVSLYTSLYTRCVTKKPGSCFLRNRLKVDLYIIGYCTSPIGYLLFPSIPWLAVPLVPVSGTWYYNRQQPTLCNKQKQIQVALGSSLLKSAIRVARQCHTLFPIGTPKAECNNPYLNECHNSQVTAMKTNSAIKSTMVNFLFVPFNSN